MYFSNCSIKPPKNLLIPPPPPLIEAHVCKCHENYETVWFHCDQKVARPSIVTGTCTRIRPPPYICTWGAGPSFGGDSCLARDELIRLQASVNQQLAKVRTGLSIKFDVILDIISSAFLLLLLHNTLIDFFKKYAVFYLKIFRSNSGNHGD